MTAPESPASTLRRAAERLRACRLPARALDGRWSVGAALADWLHSEAQAAETWAHMIADSGLDRSGTHALRVARAVLREEA